MLTKSTGGVASLLPRSNEHAKPHRPHFACIDGLMRALTASYRDFRSQIRESGGEIGSICRLTGLHHGKDQGEAAEHCGDQQCHQGRDFHCRSCFKVMTSSA
jgi:hypothetical protein